MFYFSVSVCLANESKVKNLFLFDRRVNFQVDELISILNGH